MLPTPKSYTIYPSVMPADRKTEFVVLGTERAFFPFEGEEYTLTVIPVFADEDYYVPHNKITLTATAHEGVLRFTHTFAGEGEHLPELFLGEKSLASFHVYSLYEDLYALTPLRGDLHSHSYRSDGHRDPAALVGHYREQGYDFFALTDHNRYYSGDEIVEAYANVRTDMLVLRGEEVHTPESVLHIVHAGGTKSVTEQYFTKPEEYQASLAEYRTRVPASVPEQYRDRYAAAMWSTDRIHEAGGIAIFPHPYWRPAASQSFNVNDEFTEILLTSGMFDAFELTGGMKQVGINRAVAHWTELRAKGLSIPVVGSSDVHKLEKSETFPHLFTVCFAKEKTSDAVKQAILAQNSVAVEATGEEYGREYRVHGSLRLVSYAQFLLLYYFPQYQRVTHGGGVAMRAYVMNEAPAELVELHASLAEDFRLRFLGRKAPVLPSPALLEAEGRFRACQLQGPKSKGSKVFPSVPNFQI